MKKIPLIVLGLAVFISMAIAAYIAFMDVPVAQTEVVKTISNERFFEKS